MSWPRLLAAGGRHRGDQVDVAAVRRYHSGKAGVKGFDIADRAVSGDVAGAAESLRWAMMAGEPRVVLADALAGRFTPSPGRPVVRRSVPAGRGLKMPPGGCRRPETGPALEPRTVATAVGIVAALNADVKGAAADADHALRAPFAASPNWPTAAGRTGRNHSKHESHLRRPTGGGSRSRPGRIRAC